MIELQKNHCKKKEFKVSYNMKEYIVKGNTYEQRRSTTDIC